MDYIIGSNEKKLIRRVIGNIGLVPLLALLYSMICVESLADEQRVILQRTRARTKIAGRMQEKCIEDDYCLK